MESPKPGDSYVQSFARGLQVIRSFSADAPQQTLTEVAGRAGLTRAGARRILLTLQTLGYVQSDGRLFRLTPRILDLGFAYLSSMPIWNLAEPVMEGLVAQVKESCSAAVLDGQDIVYVLRVPTRKLMSINIGVGSRLPACFTALGRVLLADLPDDALCAQVGMARAQAPTAWTAPDQDTLLDRILQVRRQGWCLVDQELEEGLVSLAAPIHGRDGRTIAALGVSGHSSRTGADMMLRDVRPLLLEAAQTISRTLALQQR